MSKMKCFGALASCALATGALYADPTYSELFDAAAEEASASWSAGKATTSNYTFNAAAGLPLSGSALPSGNKVLVIEGSASYTHGSALPSTPMVDMMVQTARPDDELGFPSSEDTTDIQIAVAVDSDGKFNAYCKNKSGTVGWYKLSDTVYDQVGWARVSFLFDYTVTPKRCQIRIDGQPIMSANGYLTADAAAGDDGVSGAWYTLANDGSGVTSMKVIGCTAVDEVVLDSTSTSYALAGGSDGSGVPYSWYDDYGISWSPDTSFDNSGLTAAQKYNNCLSPIDGQTFAVKSIKVEKVNDVEKATVEIPVFVSTTGRKVFLDYGTNKDSLTGHQEITAGQSSVSIDIPAGENVVYYRLRSTDAN